MKHNFISNQPPKLPTYSLIHNKLDVRFVDVMVKYGHFKALKKEMDSDFKPNTTHKKTLFDDILEHLED